jgi:Tfp pilus assembly protein PilN
VNVDPLVWMVSLGLAGALLVVLLQGDLRVDGVEAQRQSALLLDPRVAHRVAASGARVLALTEEPLLEP